MSGSQNTANTFHLSGGGLHVDYESTSISGQPTLTYHDSHQTRSFSGRQIETVEVPSVGTVVSVTLHIVPDVGSTSFSVIIPHVTLATAGASAMISTEGVTTLHRLSLIGRVTGQKERYTFVRLHGHAQFVMS